MSIESAIYSRLTGFAGLSALISSRIYPINAEQGVDGDYVVYDLVTTERLSTMGGDTGLVTSTFRFSIYSKTVESGYISISAQLRAALQRWSGTEAGTEVLSSFLEPETDQSYDKDGMYFMRSLDVKFIYLE